MPLLHGQQFEVTFYMLTKSQQLVAGSAVGGAPVDGKWSVAMQGPLDPHTQVGWIGTVVVVRGDEGEQLALVRVCVCVCGRHS